MGKATPDSMKSFFDQISHFTQPEELFGDLGTAQNQQLSQLEIAYKSLVKLYHPDQYTGRPTELYHATEITKFLNDAKQRAVVKIRSGVYGNLNASGYEGVINTSKHEYYVTTLLVEGSLADIYHAYYLDPGDKVDPKKEVVIKIITDPTMNALVEQEVAFYQSINHFCFPNYIEYFYTSAGKLAIVLGHVSGGCDLIELVRRYRQRHHEPGLPQEHLMWILDRFLSALGLLHENGILHGNIQPDNLMIQPETHNGLLIDFLHCRITPSPDDVFAVVNPNYCAPEVLTRHFKPHPVSDIYSLGCCMVEMLGGTGGRLDDSIALHPSMRVFLHKMTLTDPARRAADAWTLAGELKSLRRQIYGAKHQFFPLDIGG
jgi:serine/threonine protein kinase